MFIGMNASPLTHTKVRRDRDAVGLECGVVASRDSHSG